MINMMKNNVVKLTQCLLQNQSSLYPSFPCKTTFSCLLSMKMRVQAQVWHVRLSSVPGLPNNIHASSKGSCASLLPKSPPQQQIIFRFVAPTLQPFHCNLHIKLMSNKVLSCGENEMPIIFFENAVNSK
jgi:hypothetical protein